MPLTALDIDKNVVNALCAQPLSHPNSFICRECDGTMILRKGPVRIPHFAHIPDPQRKCTYDNETLDHLIMKQLVASTIPGAQIEAQIGQCRADVLAGNTIIEIQCSPISIDDMYDRINNAAAQSKRILWMLQLGHYCRLVSRGTTSFIQLNDTEIQLEGEYGSLFYFFLIGGSPFIDHITVTEPKYRRGGGICSHTFFFKQRRLAIGHLNHIVHTPFHPVSRGTLRWYVP